MKVLACGDRYWTDKELIRSWLSKLQDFRFDVLIEGEARGADSIARDEGYQMGYEVNPFPADWTRYGRSAGPIRNRAMLDMHPDLVMAFHDDLSKSKGTADTVREAVKRKIPVIVVGHTGVQYIGVSELWQMTLKALKPEGI
jgi:hypothetical protein